MTPSSSAGQLVIEARSVWMSGSSVFHSATAGAGILNASNTDP
jgi:hypothetical protein